MKKLNFWRGIICQSYGADVSGSVCWLNMLCSGEISFFDQHQPTKIHQKCKLIVNSGVRRKFSWGGSFSGIWCSFVCGVWFLWCHNLTSYLCFQTNVLAKFFDIICIFFYTHSPYFMCHCTEYKLLALQVRISEENKLTVAIQEFITAKFGCVLKRGVKHTHHYVRAIYNCKMKLR